ncbi:telomerase reverse transcriptase [Prosopis cineraria]|uniref:telomerase reverse transcriptase n=1 Tax=Prosopis cineraria TaxID=364024 RepID=UPI00240F4A70|nr:telomerase reverse transcriptase [Prosopis cineraria]
MPKKHSRVPEVLWRLFRNRARSLAETIVSLLPPPPPSPKDCLCKGLHCLGCSTDPSSFLLRPDDPSDYRKLLTHCFVVVSDNAPSFSLFIPHSRWSQNEIVRRTIEMMACGKQPVSAVSNVLCSGYTKSRCFSPILDLLSCSPWDVLLNRVGDDLMIYLLRNTSIFLPVSHMKYHQVAGPSVSGLCHKMSKCSSKFDSRMNSLPQGGCCHDDFWLQFFFRNAEEKKKTGDIDSTTGKRKCCTSVNDNDPASLVSGLDIISVKSSMPLIRNHGTRHMQTSFASVPKSTIGTESCKHKAESEGGKSSNYVAGRLGKRSRPFRWHRIRRQRQSNFSEDGVHTQGNMFPTEEDCLPGGLHCNETSLGNQEKMPWKCPCCSILQSVPTFPKRIEINRQSIFYNSEPALSVLPKRHILNFLSPNLVGSEHLIKDIFGISDVDVKALSTHCFHSSGSCLTGSACLYHSLVRWLKHVIRRSHCCQYEKLLEKHCAVPSCDQDPVGRSSSSLQRNVSKTRGQKKFHGFDRNQFMDSLEVIDSRHDAVKSYCSKSQVVSYIWAVSRSMLPPELLGDPSHWRILTRNISRFIRLRRFEKFPLKLCMHRLKTSTLPFLSTKYFSTRNAFPKYNGQNAGLHKEFINLNSTLYVIKRKLLERWIFWYFSSLVVPLVQANFYVTESEHGKQDVFYYRKTIWEKLTSDTITCLKDQRYSYLDEVAVRNILRDRAFGFSKLRLRPKENGVRMVANLSGSSRMPASTSSRKVQSFRKLRKANPCKNKFDYYQSVNSVLRDAHTILKDIQFREPEKLGSSVFDYNDVYKKLCQFFICQKEGSKTIPDFFVVTSDVLKAFDSVDQDKLLSVISDVLPKREYFLKQYDQVVSTKKSLWVRKLLSVLDESMSIGCKRFTSPASYCSMHTIFVSEGSVKHVEDRVLLSYIKQHVKNNILQLEGKFYLQGVGIPQGGILSSLLCSLYYGHLERHVIFPFLEKTVESGSCKEECALNRSSDNKVSSPCYMLIRLIDDILFISTSKEQASGFFSRLQRGFRDYNCYMNDKKFGVNFDVGQMSGSSLRVQVGEDGNSFLCWSGLLINRRTLEVQADYTRYLKDHLRSTLTVSWQGKPGLRLQERLCGFLAPKCHPIFFDLNINSAAVVRLNIYQSFLLCAMKFHCYICELSIICKLHKRFCLNSIERSISYLYGLMKKRMHSMVLHCNFRPILKLEKDEVEWLGLHAYAQVLEKKQSRHKELLAILRSRLHSHKISSSVSPDLLHAVKASNSSVLWNIKY